MELASRRKISHSRIVIASRPALGQTAAQHLRPTQLGLIGGRVELFNPDDHPTTTRTWRDRRTVSSATDVCSLIIGCNMAIRSDLLPAIGEFDPLNCPGSSKQAVFEDIDFIYRAFKKNVRIEYHPDVLLYHNHGRRSVSDLASLTANPRGRGSFLQAHPQVIVGAEVSPIVSSLDVVEPAKNLYQAAVSTIGMHFCFL